MSIIVRDVSKLLEPFDEVYLVSLEFSHFYPVRHSFKEERTTLFNTEDNFRFTLPRFYILYYLRSSPYLQFSLLDLTNSIVRVLKCDPD